MSSPWWYVQIGGHHFSKGQKAKPWASCQLRGWGVQKHLWHDDVLKWKHFPCYSPFVWGIHRSPVNSSHKGQWRGALMFSLICTWINGWVSSCEAGDLRRYCAHYDATVMSSSILRALKFSPVNKICIFQCIGEIFCVKFQRYPLKFHTKYHTHT